MNAEEFAARAKRWLLPPGLAAAISRLRRRHGHAGEAELQGLLARNRRFVGAHQGQRAWLLGNGSSLAAVDLSLLRDEITFSMNWFSKHDLVGEWQPTYHCVAEPGANMTSELVQGLIDGLQPRAHFFRHDAKRVVETTEIDLGKVFFVELSGKWDQLRAPLRFNLVESVPGINDTSLFSLYMAIAMGCSPIILLGVDQDYLSHRSIHRHFYPEERVTAEYLGDLPYRVQIEGALAAWTSFERLHDYAESRGQLILNANPESFLDVFPVITFEEALEIPSGLSSIGEIRQSGGHRQA